MNDDERFAITMRALADIKIAREAPHETARRQPAGRLDRGAITPARRGIWKGTPPMGHAHIGDPDNFRSLGYKGCGGADDERTRRRPTPTPARSGRAADKPHGQTASDCPSQPTRPLGEDR
jgi:hypothetical protein